MGSTLTQVIAALPPERQARIDAQYRTLKQEVETLGDLRRIAGKAQRDVAAKLNIKQPTVSKIERQADMYLSTLQSYIAALGGDLALVVTLPNRPALRLERLGDVILNVEALPTKAAAE
jgi:transcriptional regulator with XRE-family HTH domain